MAVIKIACTKCGQRVSGDESFYGTTVECPVCSSIIAFPEPIISGSAPAPQAAPPATQEAQSNPSPETAGNAAPASSDPGMPALGGHGGDPAMMQTTSIPLLPSNIVTQDANRIGALNAAMRAAPDEEPPSTLQSILSMVFGILGIIFFFVGASILFSPAAIIVGHIALAKTKYSRIQPAPGRTMALIGVILGYAGLCVLLVLLITFPLWSKLVPGLSRD